MAERVIKDGEFLSGRSAEALNKIVYGVGQASERMHQIAVATSEQSMGSQVIRQAMEQVSSMIEQIATATREQTRGSDMIIQAVDTMKSLSGQVSRASREQSKAGNTIVAQTGRVIEIVATIRTGSATQRQEGERIIQSMQTLRATNVASVEANAIMGQAVGSISRQTDALQQELALFTIAPGDGQATVFNSGKVSSNE
jgi:methyl-accepting chemotaxis protein